MSFGQPTPEILKKFLLTLTKEEKARYYQHLSELGKAMEGKKLAVKHRLFVMERVLTNQDVSIPEAMKL